MQCWISQIQVKRSRKQSDTRYISYHTFKLAFLSTTAGIVKTQQQLQEGLQDTNSKHTFKIQIVTSSQYNIKMELPQLKYIHLDLHFSSIVNPYILSYQHCKTN